MAKKPKETLTCMTSAGTLHFEAGRNKVKVYLDSLLLTKIPISIMFDFNKNCLQESKSKSPATLRRKLQMQYINHPDCMKKVLSRLNNELEGGGNRK